MTMDVHRSAGALLQLGPAGDLGVALGCKRAAWPLLQFAPSVMRQSDTFSDYRSRGTVAVPLLLYCRQGLLSRVTAVASKSRSASVTDVVHHAPLSPPALLRGHPHAG
jgi:hypothetical protein